MPDERQSMKPRAVTQTPEERELDKKTSELVGLEAELAQRELDLLTLQGVLHAFEGRYVRIVGARYAELDELEAQIAEAEERRNVDDSKLHDQAEEARAKATESADATGAVLQRAHGIDFAPAEDLKKLYRDIARRIHPDLTTDDKERVRRNRVMAEANRAYEDGDEARLRAILEEWQSSPDSVEGEGVAAELVRAIRKIHQVRRRLAEIAAEIGTLTNSDLYGLKEKVDAAQLHGRDLLGQMAEQLNGQIKLARARLDDLVAPVR